LLSKIVAFFNFPLGSKRVYKLLRNTEGFETISQSDFWAPIYFSPKLPNYLKVYSLWLSLRISRQKSFTEKFVENYVAIAREFISTRRREEKSWALELFQSISQTLLESEQGEFFLKLISDLPGKSLLIPSDSGVETWKYDIILGSIRALVTCANCKVLEKSEKQFLKCSRCGFVFYCSKACQRNNWPSHKQICKEISKQS
jgi:uncharacterized C2H2 Zn-finger protein